LHAGWLEGLYDTDLKRLEKILYVDKYLYKEKNYCIEELVNEVNNIQACSPSALIMHKHTEREYEKIGGINENGITRYHIFGFKKGKELISTLLWKSGDEVRQFLIQNGENDVKNIRNGKCLAKEEKLARQKSTPHLFATIFLQKIIPDKIKQDRTSLERVNLLSERLKKDKNK
jgi:hypothetical protein